MLYFVDFRRPKEKFLGILAFADCSYIFLSRSPVLKIVIEFAIYIHYFESDFNMVQSRKKMFDWIDGMSWSCREIFRFSWDYVDSVDACFFGQLLVQ